MCLVGISTVHLLIYLYLYVYKCGLTLASCGWSGEWGEWRKGGLDVLGVVRVLITDCVFLCQCQSVKAAVFVFLELQLQLQLQLQAKVGLRAFRCCCRRAGVSLHTRSLHTCRSCHRRRLRVNGVWRRITDGQVSK